MDVIIQKWGNSQGIRLPKNILKAIEWDENDKLDLRVEEGKIIIEKAVKRKNIKELFKNYNEDYKSNEIDWGTPQGNEVW